MVLKILGIALAVWIVFALLGALLKVLVPLLVVGAVIFVGSAAYVGIRNRNRGQLR
jgi:hypothetical protein